MAARLAQGFGEPAGGWANVGFAKTSHGRGLGRVPWPFLAAAGIASLFRVHAVGPVAINFASPSATPRTFTQPSPVADRSPALHRTINVRHTTSVGADRFRSG